jgi:hypothetical protein
VGLLDVEGEGEKVDQACLEDLAGLTADRVGEGGL